MSFEILNHSVVYRKDDEFAAWPFNGGMWRFKDGEVVVGFTRSKADYSKHENIQHGKMDPEGGEQVLIRSFDGGETWPEESITTMFKRPEFDPVADSARRGETSDISYDPKADGFMLWGGFGFPTKGKPAGVVTMVSTDRGKTWSDPVRLPAWLPGASRYTYSFACGRPSYVVRKDGMLLLFGSASRKSLEDKVTGIGEATSPVVWASWNGGASWGFLSEVELTPRLPVGILPYPLILPNGDILMAVRRQYNGYNAYTQIYRSTDHGRTWSFLSRVNDWGAPANLIIIPDGRLVCVYGYRQEGYGVRARISGDSGATWGDELIIRDDGGSWDLGYPRSIVNPDGTILTVYYMNLKTDEIQQDGGVRHIASTLWKV
jgi:hypothetical protein